MKQRWMGLTIVIAIALGFTHSPKESYIVMPILFFNFSADPRNPKEYSYARIGYPRIQENVILSDMEDQIRKLKIRVLDRDIFFQTTLKDYLEEMFEATQITALYVMHDRKDEAVTKKDAKGPVLEGIPNLPNAKLIMPIGLEMEDTQHHTVSGFLMVAVVDKNSKLIAYAKKEYNPGFTQPEANKMFLELLKEALKKS